MAEIDLKAVQPAPSGTPTGPTRGAMTFILIVVVMDMLAVGLIVPVIVPLVQGFFGTDTIKGAKALGFLMTAWAMLQFFSSPILGALSDQFGRRPIILISNLGFAISFFITATSTSFAILLVSRLISGATAGNISAANAYVADCTPPEGRAKAFGLLGAAFGVGFTLGPALGGLLGSIDVRLPFFVAGTLCLANSIYGWFVLPESLKPENRTKFTWAKANPIGALMVFKDQPMLYALLPVYGLFALAQNVFPSVFVLYAQHRYGFETWVVGATLAVASTLGIFSQVFLVQRVVKAVGERRGIIVGLIAGTLGFAAYGLAPSPLWFWASMPVMMLWNVFNPSFQSLVTQRVSPKAQGQTQGGLAAISSITGVFAPSLYTGLFAWGIGGSVSGLALPGAPFLVASFCLLCALAITAFVVQRSPGSQKQI